MDLLVRGKYVITDASSGEDGILADGAAYFSKGKVVDVGGYDALKKKYPDATVKGSGDQLLMPGLIDGHSHGWGLSAIQRGVSYDFLENALIDWAFMFNIDPELNAMMSALRHLRSGCTTMHHNNWGEAPNMGEIAEKAIAGYQKSGIRLAFSPGVRNDNTLAYDDTEFFKTLPPGLQETESTLGRIVVAPAARGRNLGRELVRRGIAHNFERWPHADIRIHAQAHLEAYYCGLGFATQGEVYDLDGIPHLEMLCSKTPA